MAVTMSFLEPTAILTATFTPRKIDRRENFPLPGVEVKGGRGAAGLLWQQAS